MTIERNTELRREGSYVGVSGVAHASEQEMLRELGKKYVVDTSRFIMSGVQATEKTQLRDIPNKYGRDWHPIGDEIRTAGFADETGLTRSFVHGFFPTITTLERGLGTIMDRTSEFSSGIQLNMLQWMDKEYRPLLERFRSEYPDVSLVLQAHHEILDRHNPPEVAKHLEELPVSYVLFDASHGRGKELDVEQIRPFVEEVYEQDLPMGVVVAGGLEQSNIWQLFGSLIERYPGLSCDAEGRLRAGPQGRTWLSMQAVEGYLAAWAQTIDHARGVLVE